MKKIIYTILSITMLTACKKESSNSSTNPTNGTSTAIAKYGNGITDVEGNKYKTVIIGTQEWMGENLKVSKYSDGSAITNGTDDYVWNNNKNGAWCNYDKDISNNLKYGKLYNWNVTSPTMNGNKNVCPSGWHVPTNEEWKILTNYLGGDNIAAGGKLKEEGVSSWNSPNTDATNSSLFSALPGGGRYSDANFGGIGSKGYWWSSSEYSTDGAWYLLLNRSTGVEEVSYEVKKYGLSVRCLKD